MKPEVGMKATLVLWRDSHAYTVIGVSKNGKTVTVQRDRVEAKHKPEDLGFASGGFAGHFTDVDKQKWDCFPDPEGKIKKFSLRKNGRWCEVGDACTGSELRLGYGYEFYDYNF